MIEVVVKRDGTKEEFNASKLNKWAEWAAHSLGNYVDWSTVVLSAVSTLPRECSSEQLQQRLVKVCLDMDSWSYNKMAGRLYAALLNKKIFNNHRPTVQDLHKRLVELGLMVPLNYSDDEYHQVEKLINHDLDYKSTYFELHHTRSKYSIKNRVTGEEYETQQFTYMRMAMAAAETEPIKTRMIDVKKWYYYFSNKVINCPTPDYVNLGTPLKGYASCCTYTVGDSARSLAIGDHIAYTMTYMSAGIGSHLKCRSVGDPVRGGVIKHQGKLPYYRAQGKAVTANLQNGRGGAVTTYYTWTDPEAMDIALLKNPRSVEDKKIRDLDYNFGSNKFFAKKVALNEEVFNFSYLNAPDLYEAQYSKDPHEFEKLYEKYEKDSEFKKTYFNARDLVVTALTESEGTGRHYLHFTDEMNRHNPFKETVYSFNLCVAPETQILTRKGYSPISEYEGATLDIWNGEEWSEVEVVKTGNNQKLLTVTTSAGQSLDCTEYHKWYVFDGYGKPCKEVRTHELKVGDKLIKFDLPVIEGNKRLKFAYDNGFYSGDGSCVGNTSYIYLYHEKMELNDKIKSVRVWNHQENSKRMIGKAEGLQEKYFVPIDDYSVESRLEWLAGWLDSDGCVYRNGTNEALTGSSIHYSFLQEIQLMLQTLGVSCKISTMRDAGDYLLPANDGTGENKYYSCQKVYRLLISSCDTFKLLSLGLKLHRLKVDLRRPQRDAKRFNEVISVVDNGRFDDTYCFTEHKRNMGMFNGILTGQCVEYGSPTKPYENMLDLYSLEDHGRGEIGLCSLAAINIANVKSDEEYADACYYALKLKDKTIHMTEYELPHLGVTAKARMNVGIGIVGLAYHMAKNKQSYYTKEGKNFLHEIAETHAWHLYNASLRLGKELGNAPWMHKTLWPEGWLPIDTYNKNVDKIVSVGLKRDWEDLRKRIIENGGIRNSICINFMPSEASSKASGTTNGLYPIRDYTLLKTDDETLVYWAAPEGERLRKWYELAWDIPTKDMIDCYAIFQKFCDQSISADLYRKVVGDTTVNSSELIEEYLYMVKMGLKSRYYQVSKTSDGSDGCGSGGCTL